MNSALASGDRTVLTLADGLLSDPSWLWPIPSWCLFTTYWRDGTVYREMVATTSAKATANPLSAGAYGA